MFTEPLVSYFGFISLFIESSWQMTTSILKFQSQQHFFLLSRILALNGKKERRMWGKGVVLLLSDSAGGQCIFLPQIPSQPQEGKYLGVQCCHWAFKIAENRVLDQFLKGSFEKFLENLKAEIKTQYQ